MCIPYYLFQLFALIFCDYLIKVIYGNSILSSYHSTRMINHHCDPSWKLFTGETNSQISCAKWCSREKDCKRFLYCKSTLLCSLFGDGNDCISSASFTSCRCFQKAKSCDGVSCECPWGYYGSQCDQIANDCSDAYSKGINRSKFIITNIKPASAPESFEVRCWLSGGGYTNLLERDLTCEGEYFNRSMADYEDGFGLFMNNKWLGFKKIHQIMHSSSNYKLAVYAADVNGNICMTYYRSFSIGNTASFYSLNYLSNSRSSYFPDCGDSLYFSKGKPFSTYDQDQTSFNCASKFGGGWWFSDQSSCSKSFFFGASTTDNIWINSMSLDDRPFLSLSFSRS